jgi:soluble lytic murein transglycosylase-like protein
MQLMPRTALAYGVLNTFDVSQNIDGGAHYLADLLRHYHGNTRFALAAYNAGPAIVDRFHGVPAIARIQYYVNRIMAKITN